MEQRQILPGSQVTRSRLVQPRSLAEFCSYADIVLVDNSFLAPLGNDLRANKDLVHIIEAAALEGDFRTLEWVESRTDWLIAQIGVVLQTKPAYMVTCGLKELDDRIDSLRKNYAATNSTKVANGLRPLWNRGQRVKSRILNNLRACRQVFEKNTEYHTSPDKSPFPPWFREDGEVFSNMELYAALQGMVETYPLKRGEKDCSAVDKEFVAACFYLSALQGKKVVGLTNDHHIKERFRYCSAQVHRMDLSPHTANPDIVEALRETKADLVSAYYNRGNFNFYRPNDVRRVH
jgi:hypothetical protein